MEQTAFTPGIDARMAIANSVAAELARHRYSKRAAALALGMTPLYLYRRLNGEVDFAGTDLQAIADLLGIHAGEFFHGNEKRPPITGDRKMNMQTLDYSAAGPAEVIHMPVRGNTDFASTLQKQPARLVHVNF